MALPNKKPGFGRAPVPENQPWPKRRKKKRGKSTVMSGGGGGNSGGFGGGGLQGPDGPYGIRALFTGERGPFAMLLLKNLGLTVVTLGIYRFWAKTAVRRFFWNNTQIADEPLEYTGTGLELFIGFLIAIAIILPLSLLSQFLSTMAGSMGIAGSVIGGLVIPLLFLWLVHVAIFRMTRYRATRTRYRGVAFHLDGSSASYGLKGLGWTFASILSLGLAVPWMRSSLMAARLNQMRFGNQSIGYEGTGTGLFRYYMVVYGMFIVIVGAGFLQGMSTVNNPQAAMMQGPLHFLPVVLLMMLFPVAVLYYRIQEFRYFVRMSHINGVRLHSEMPIGATVGWGFLTVLSSAFTVGLLLTVGFFGFGEAIKETIMAGGNASPPFFTMFIAALYMLAAFAAGRFIFQLIFQFYLVERGCSTFTLSHMGPIEEAVRTSGEEDLKHGEGLADAFDVGGGL